MTIKDIKGSADNLMPVENVLISVFDKRGLDEFVLGLLKINRGIRFISTTDTSEKIEELAKSAYYRISIAEYSTSPGLDGFLIKTYHPDIRTAILGKRNDPEFQRYPKEILHDPVYIDMVVANFQPFKDVISQPGVSFEKANANIDIIGPAILRAAAKNFASCAAVCDPKDYSEVLAMIRNNNGCTLSERRRILAQKVFDLTAGYDGAIFKYMWEKKSDEIITDLAESCNTE